MTTATAKRHLDQERCNLQSTKTQLLDKSTEDTFSGKIQIKTYDYIVTSIPAPEKDKTSSDQTGRFPYQSSHDTQYIFIL